LKIKDWTLAESGTKPPKWTLGGSHFPVASKLITGGTARNQGRNCEPKTDNRELFVMGITAIGDARHEQIGGKVHKLESLIDYQIAVMDSAVTSPLRYGRRWRGCWHDGRSAARVSVRKEETR
jgi:hypothetical protein